MKIIVEVSLERYEELKDSVEVRWNSCLCPEEVRLGFEAAWTEYLEGASFEKPCRIHEHILDRSD